MGLRKKYFSETEKEYLSYAKYNTETLQTFSKPELCNKKFKMYISLFLPTKLETLKAMG